MMHLIYSIPQCLLYQLKWRSQATRVRVFNGLEVALHAQGVFERAMQPKCAKSVVVAVALVAVTAIYLKGAIKKEQSTATHHQKNCYQIAGLSEMSPQG